MSCKPTCAFKVFDSFQALLAKKVQSHGMASKGGQGQGGIAVVQQLQVCRQGGRRLARRFGVSAQQ